MKQFFTSIIALLTLLLGGCFKDIDFEPLPADARILAFGDSLTRGKGVSEEHSYPAVLAQLTGRFVINEGVSGEVSKQGLKRLPRLLADYRPDLLILMHGGNDILRNTDPAITKANLAMMISLARERDIPVLLIGIPKKSLFSKTAPLYQELAEQYSLVLEGSVISSLLKRPGMKSDSVHFNQAGYQAIAERIVEVLEEHGAL